MSASKRRRKAIKRREWTAAYIGRLVDQGRMADDAAIAYFTRWLTK